MNVQAPVATNSTESAQPQASVVTVNEIDTSLLKRLREQTTASDASALFAAPRPYQLGIADVLQITVWDHPELAAALGAPAQAQLRPADAPAGFVIDQSGDIQFPYAGTLHVAGLRVEQVRDLLTRRLSNMFRNPQVTVRVASFRSSQVYVDGEVRAPGAQAINDVPMTLYEAISRAGGFTAAADESRMTLVRDGGRYLIDMAKMVSQRQNPASVMLKSGDLLRVSSRDENGVFVMGEVNRPTTAVPMKSGGLTLSDALSQAGSINVASANATQMYVIRNAMGDTAEVYHLDAQSPVAMVLANQFELKPKDVVYVDSTGLARFSRILSQLLPAINAGLTAAVVTK
ncbi:polysaccharide biosynthesis/export family protein [Paraburkholderia franconis]